jgi:DNA-binding IclR family transcriptional regulator
MATLRERASDDRRPDDFVQSVGRALRVLEVVSASPKLPVKAIARRCELNVSTTYHLVRTLAYEGYLDRLPDGTYVAGAEVARRFHELVAAIPSHGLVTTPEALVDKGF